MFPRIPKGICLTPAAPLQPVLPLRGTSLQLAITAVINHWNNFTSELHLYTNHYEFQQDSKNKALNKNLMPLEALQAELLLTNYQSASGREETV